MSFERRAAHVRCRTVIELLRLVPLIISRASDVGVPYSVQPAKSCLDARWSCQDTAWQRGLKIAMVRLALQVLRALGIGLPLSNL